MDVSADSLQIIHFTERQKENGQNHRDFIIVLTSDN